MNYYFLIPADDINLEMVEAALKDVGIKVSPKLADLIYYRSKLRHLMDNTVPESPIRYCLIKMTHDFSTPFVGHRGHTASEMKAIIAEMP